MNRNFQLLKHKKAQFIICYLIAGPNLLKWENDGTVFMRRLWVWGQN